MAQDDPVRIIRHVPENIPDCGSFEVRFADGRASEYFYWDDNPGRRSITRTMDQVEALEQARAPGASRAGEAGAHLPLL